MTTWHCANEVKVYLLPLLANQSELTLTSLSVMNRVNRSVVFSHMTTDNSGTTVLDSHITNVVICDVMVLS